MVEVKGKVDSIQRFLGSKVKVIETNGSLCDLRLVDGELQCTQKSNAFANTLKEHTGLIDSIVLATDDDLAGELIGLHAAEMAKCAQAALDDFKVDPETGDVIDTEGEVIGNLNEP